ncbi:MAG: serine hydrolase, partial [Pseudomonas sp.]|nr:serine hydrolase [Pseudomonas sp.]
MPQDNLLVVRYADDRDGSFNHNEMLKRVRAAFAEEVQP